MTPAPRHRLPAVVRCLPLPALVAAGCGGYADSGFALPSCGGGTPLAEIGTGTETFSPIADGDRVRVGYGFSCLRLVRFRWRVQGLEGPVDWRADMCDARTGAGIAASPTRSYPQSLTVVDHGCESGTGHRLFVDVPAAGTVDNPAVFSLAVWDVRGRTARVERSVLLDGSGPCDWGGT